MASMKLTRLFSTRCHSLDYKSNFHLNLPVVCTASLFHMTVIGSELAQEIHNKINVSVKFQFITKIITLTSRSDASITNSFASRNSEEFLLENYFQFIKFVYKKYLNSSGLI